MFKFIKVKLQTFWDWFVTPEVGKKPMDWEQSLEDDLLEEVIQFIKERPDDEHVVFVRNVQSILLIGKLNLPNVKVYRISDVWSLNDGNFPKAKVACTKTLNNPGVLLKMALLNDLNECYIQGNFDAPLAYLVTHLNVLGVQGKTRGIQWSGNFIKEDF